MNSSGLSFNKTVIASVLSTLLAAVLTWLFGFWTVVWDAAVAATKCVLSMILFSIQVPLGVLIVGAAMLLMFMFLFFTRKETSISGKPSGTDIRYSSKAFPTGAWAQSPTVESEALSDKEIVMLKVLAIADGQAIAIDVLAQRSRMSNLATQQTADHLLSRGYVKHNRDLLYGSMLLLSPAGRDFVLSAGYTH
jgi:hypothetical protein